MKIDFTTSGWFLFAWWISLLAAFLYRLVAREERGAAQHVILIGITTAWMIWLVS